MLYLAYGSNLHIGQMSMRCPNADPIRAFDLPDYKLVFRSVADIEPEVGASVPVALWDISPRCEAALDRYEGVENGMYRKEYIKIDEGKALIYIMNDDGLYPPGKFYYTTIEEGYQDWELDDEPLRTAHLESIAESYRT